MRPAIRAKNLTPAACPSGLCCSLLHDFGQAAHLCEHGRPCRYEQTTAGDVKNWKRSCCRDCNDRLERKARGKRRVA